jgi:hypothetical protein
MVQTIAAYIRTRFKSSLQTTLCISTAKGLYALDAATGREVGVSDRHARWTLSTIYNGVAYVGD